MTLYTANVMDVATPVKKQIKNINSKVNEESNNKVLSHRQLKARETREKKKQEAEDARLLAEKEANEMAQKEEETRKIIEQKKQVQKEKRLARKNERENQKLEVEQSVSSIDSQIDEAIKEELPKKIEDSEPPAWFKSIVHNFMREDSKISGDKKPKKQIKEEADEVANIQWNKPDTRKRIGDQLDNVHNKMFKMMFGR